MDSGQSHNNPQGHVHHPEFIIVEDDQTTGQKTESQKDTSSYASFEELSSVRFPFAVRVASFGLSFLMFMSAIAAAIGLFFTGCLILITFGYYDKAKLIFKRCHNWWRKAIVLSLGFFVAVFSPSFGFAIIIIYFLMLGEKINHDILRRMLHSATR